MVAIQCPAKLGRYILLRHMQSGGMADLYAAKASGVENFERLVAIKIVRPPGSGDEVATREFIHMFIDEARLAGQLTHANIAQIYELGRVHDRLYIAMELVEGHNLVELRQRLGADRYQLPVPFAAYVISQTALGLDYAHRREDLQGRPLNLVHRDVSPHNILVSYEGEVKIVDFGVAKAEMRRTETFDGTLKGKIGYMPPEQVRSENVDRRADIFALGSVLFELLAGRKLYQAGDTFELLEMVRNADQPELRLTLPNVPEELLDILRRALAADPAARFQSAADVAKALEPFLIHDRSIYGAAEASAVMREAYPDTPNRRRDYVNPTDSEIRDLGREFAPSVVEAFDRALGPAPAPALAPTPSVAVAPAPAVAPVPAPAEPAQASASTSHVASVPTSDPVRAGAPSLIERREPSGFAKATTDEFNVPELDVPLRHSRAELELPSPAPRRPTSRLSARRRRRSGGRGLLVLAAFLAAAGFAYSRFGIPDGFGLGREEPQSVPSEAKSEQTDKNAKPPEPPVGFLSVTTKSGKSVTVWIDGKRVGRTPLEAHQLEHGAHTLKVAFRSAGRKVESRPQRIKVGDNNTRDTPLQVVINDGALSASSK
ncbi:MAG: serine/threonine-protein kinase [Myxococcota bacterium]